MNQKTTIATILFLITFCLFVGCKKTDDEKPVVTDEMIRAWIKDLNILHYPEVIETNAWKNLINAGKDPASNKRTIDLLIENLENPTALNYTRDWSALILGLIGEPFDIIFNVLLSVFEDQAGDHNYGFSIQAQAMEGLDELFKQKPLEFTIGYFTHPSPIAREAAVESVTFRIKRDTDEGSTAIIKIKQIIVNEKILEVALVAAKVLRFNTIEEDKDFIVEVLENNEHWIVRETVVRALGELGNFSPELIQTIGEGALRNDTSKYVRRQVAKALGANGDVAAIPYLETALEYEEDNDVIDAINEAIALINGSKYMVNYFKD